MNTQRCHHLNTRDFLDRASARAEEARLEDPDAALG